MMKRQIWTLAALASLAACGQTAGDGNAANTAANAAANVASPAKKRPTYCFFKDALTKGWTATTDTSGNVTVKGQAKVDDRRFRGDLSESEVTGNTASVWLTMAQNTGYSDDDGWWDVAVTVPNSAAVANVTVLCGKKEVAKLAVRR
jgi:hypothetical protein